jgi:D-alanyl-lipoteichoic acid acyltransferase DltB (MBOAT superfamily)
MMPQFASKWNLVKNYKNIALGLFIFSIGLFKKVIIADTFATWATVGFDKAVTLNFLEAWATSLSYTFQLYFDFSGYTDMAIGVSLLFNIKLPINFNSPYKAVSIQDFWRRWHITLSRFLKDYIYIPLGGNRFGELRTYANLMATFMIGGFWHGASWLFLFWGFLHGFALVVHRIWDKLGFRLWRWLAWFITFNFINISWIFFRAKDWDDAMKVLSNMIYGDFVLAEKIEKVIPSLSEYGVKFAKVTEHIGDGSKVLNWIVAGFILILAFQNSTQKMSSFKSNYRTIVFTYLCFVYSVLSFTKVSEFLYFNF